jgi:hypothetical protein
MAHLQRDETRVARSGNWLIRSGSSDKRNQCLQFLQVKSASGLALCADREPESHAQAVAIPAKKANQPIGWLKRYHGAADERSLCR